MSSGDKLDVEKNDFKLQTPDDDLRVDSLCKNLMLSFYEHLLSKGTPPGEATALATGADYFVRDFVVDRKRCSIFDEHPSLVRQFAGNWYIANTLEPNLTELSGHLRGICEFYRFLAANGLVSEDYLQIVKDECAQVDYYGKRIESFWAIEGDGYFAWESECTLKEP